MDRGRVGTLEEISRRGRFWKGKYAQKKCRAPRRSETPHDGVKQDCGKHGIAPQPGAPSYSDKQGPFP